MKNITEAAKILRHYSLLSTTKAGSGHPTSCLSSADLMAALFFGGNFRFDIENPDNLENDRLIFSKGHAAPLFYAMWAAVGAIEHSELETLRMIESRLEGHPTMKFPFTEVPTGSLGQGLSAGVGMAISAKYLDKTKSRIFVLLGDSEMAEGSVWEGMEIATHFKLDNLVAILDANRLGQRGETLHGHDLEKFEAKAEAFGWYPLVIDGHNIDYIDAAYKTAENIKDKPVMIIAKTFKGKGISTLEDKEGKHGVAVKETELAAAMLEIDAKDVTKTFKLAKPKNKTLPEKVVGKHITSKYTVGDFVATREAYGKAIGEIAKNNKNIIALDAETSNSTFAESVKKTAPDQFFEMFIAEQNMVSVATGMARRGKIPFVSTFSAFLTRAYDQIRMAAYGYGNIKIAGSHAGVSIGEDGTSQMGLEDISMMRSIFGSTVLYPSDGNSTLHLVQEMADQKGISYLRTTRGKTPVIYSEKETFPIGGCKLHKFTGDKPEVVIIGAGITLHEALKAQKILFEEGKDVVVVDLYSIKPIDTKTLLEVTKDVSKIIVVEDHFEEGGIAEVVRSAIGNERKHIVSLAVRKMPQSGKPQELLEYEDIDAKSIVKAALE